VLVVVAPWWQRRYTAWQAVVVVVVEVLQVVVLGVVAGQVLPGSIGQICCSRRPAGAQQVRTSIVDACVM
jgi:hypothetical protein